MSQRRARPVYASNLMKLITAHALRQVKYGALCFFNNRSLSNMNDHLEISYGNSCLSLMGIDETSNADDPRSL